MPGSVLSVRLSSLKALPFLILSIRNVKVHLDRRAFSKQICVNNILCVKHSGEIDPSQETPRLPLRHPISMRAFSKDSKTKRRRRMNSLCRLGNDPKMEIKPDVNFTDQINDYEDIR